MKLPALIATAALLFITLPAVAQSDDPPGDPRGDLMPPAWITTTNQPCKVWNPEPEANESVTWSGGCKNGYASGKGILQWTENGMPDVEFDGEYANGKRNGHGVMITPDGKRAEGDWLNDKLLTDNSNAI